MRQCVIDIVTKLVDNTKVYDPLPDKFFKDVRENDEDHLFEKIMKIPGISSSTFSRTEFDQLK